MKLIKFGTKGKMVLIGEDSKKAVWYSISDTVRPYLEKFKEGDDVKIRAEKNNGRETLLFIEAENGEPTTETKPTYNKPSVPFAPTGNVSMTPKTYGKSKEEQDSIKAQAIGHMTSRTLIAMQGQVTEENVYDLMESIYSKYKEIVG